MLSISLHTSTNHFFCLDDNGDDDDYDFDDSALNDNNSNNIDNSNNSDSCIDNKLYSTHSQNVSESMPEKSVILRNDATSNGRRKASRRRYVFSLDLKVHSGLL